MAVMQPLSFKRHRFHPDIIRQAVWLYFRFTLSLRDVEDLMAERGIDVTYETIRCWVDKFGPAIAANMRKRRHRADCVRGIFILLMNPVEMFILKRI